MQQQTQNVVEKKDKKVRQVVETKTQAHVRVKQCPTRTMSESEYSAEINSCVFGLGFKLNTRKVRAWVKRVTGYVCRDFVQPEYGGFTYGSPIKPEDARGCLCCLRYKETQAHYSSKFILSAGNDGDNRNQDDWECALTFRDFMHKGANIADIKTFMDSGAYTEALKAATQFLQDTGLLADKESLTTPTVVVVISVDVSW